MLRVRAGGKFALPIGSHFRYNPNMADKSIKVIPKKRGRPATGKDPLIALRLPPGMIEAVDDWGCQRGTPSRSEAIRDLIERGLQKKEQVATVTHDLDQHARIFRKAQEHHKRGEALDEGTFEKVAAKLTLSSGSLCRKRYYDYKKLIEQKRPAILLLQKWGATQIDAAELMDQLLSAAGPSGTDILIERMKTRREWDGKRRIAWLIDQASEIAANPRYWPTTRSPRAETGAIVVLEALRKAVGNRLTKAQLIHATHKKENSIAALIHVLERDGEIVRIYPGVYGLPSSDQNIWRSAREVIMEALTTAPNKTATIAKLTEMTGRTPSALSAAIYRLTNAGLIIRLRRGLFALPQERARSTAQ
jgi:Arc/MetJ-type ribon-helix-helix transcriptional regulator/predicted transcriptional regulator